MKTKVKKKYQGNHFNRCEPRAGNPRELVFALEWQDQNERHRTLSYLMGKGSQPADTTSRDHLVASSVIQWLGSPVGFSFLQDTVRKLKRYDRRQMVDVLLLAK